MCSRFTLRTPTKVIAETFGLTTVPELPPRYNITPAQEVAAIRFDPHQGTRQLSLLRWGLIPPWAGDPPIGYRMINARAETVVIKRAFCQAFQKNRCLVVADGFFEWKRTGMSKQPYYIRLQNDRPFAFAGLAEHWHRGNQTVDSCTIITTDANELMESIHDRMPVILSPEEYELWLEPEFHHQEELLSMLRPFPAKEMEAYPVGKVVNNPTNETKECIEAVR